LVHEAGLGLLIEGRRIEKIAQSAEMIEEFCPQMLTTANKNPTDRGWFGELHVLDLAGRAVVPGLVDAHCHLLWAGDRSEELKMRQDGLTYPEIAARGGGINLTVTATRKASDAELRRLGKQRLSEAVRNGTTSLEAKSGYGLSTEEECRLLQIAQSLHAEPGLPNLRQTWLGAHATPAGQSQEEYVQHLLSDQLPAVVDQGIATSADVFCEPGWFTLDETEEICHAAMDAGLGIRLHVDEFRDGGGAELASELGAVTADHAIHSSDDARAKCAAAGTLQGFLPGTPYVLGSDQWPPAKRCMEEEWPWTVASDLNPNCQSISLPFAANLATLRMGVDPLSALVACSRNPATGMADAEGLDTGVIAEGGMAALNVLRGKKIDGWCQTPGHSPFQATYVGGTWATHSEFE
jgi:imidazolonepropionase